MQITPYKKHTVVSLGGYSMLLTRDVIENDDPEDFENVKYIIKATCAFEVSKDEETYWLEQSSNLSYGISELDRDEDFYAMCREDIDMMKDLQQLAEQMHKVAKQNLKEL